MPSALMKQEKSEKTAISVNELGGCAQFGNFVISACSIKSLLTIFGLWI